MFSSPFFRTFWVQEIFRLLAMEAVLVFLFWLLYRYGGFLKNFPFADALFIAGGIMLMMAGFGMLRGDTDLAVGTKQIGPSPVVRPSGSDLHEETERKLSFGVRLAICGALTLLISLVNYLINKTTGG